MPRHSFTGLSVTVNTTELLVKIKANRARHLNTYKQALEVYRIKSIAKLNEIVDLLEEGKMPDTYIKLPVPEEHIDDYDRVISMIEMTTSNEILLNEQTYSNLVLDSWDWSDYFATNTVAYVGNSMQ